ERPITHGIELLESGKVLGIKGLGGFHLACNASDDRAVARIREWKFREAKPFALMSSSLERIREYCHMEAEEERLLTSPIRPIVLLRKRKGALLSEHIAPGNRYLGVMLPYTPLHHLLLDSSLQALVMTSGNRGGNPIISDNDGARSELNVADAILSHERDIRSKCDDSVTRVMRGQEVLVRRSRGYAPFPVQLSLGLQSTLACGADLKNTFCLAKGCYAFLSQHIGDLENARTFDAYREMIDQCKTLFRIEPKLVAHDLHPDYFSTRYAREQELPRVAVQHHHAHIASCMAEHRLDGNVIGLAFDGTGYGPDGTIWGGEFLVAGLKGYERKGHLAPVMMPGGESAIKNPWRMAFSHLYSVFGEGLLDQDLAFLGARDADINELMVTQLRRGLNAPLTSSCGRLFDAVASLIGLRQTVTYDGQAAIELENIARPGIEGSYRYDLVDHHGATVVDTGPIITDLLEDLRKSVPSTTMASRFHVTMAKLATEMCCMIRDKEDLDRVVLSGGVFQNALLTDLLCSRLERKGFTPILHKLVPPNDGGICLGQVAVANAGRES
ncbi:MAG: carbamoyltransferase HypF, partial [Methanopyri archaeon]|nr:carbamoyltransferase HypF [Methanopyri archaeon]